MNNFDKDSDFITQGRISYIKWIVGLSAATMSLCLTLLFKPSISLEYKWLFKFGLAAWLICILSGIFFFSALIEGSAYHFLADYHNFKNWELLKLTGQKHDKIWSICYMISSITFVIGYLLVGIFILINLT